MTHLPDGNWAIEAGTGYGQCIKFKEKLFEKQTPLFADIELSASVSVHINGING